MAATTHSSTHALVATRDGNHVFATKPTPLTRFLRTFLLWQIVRFVVINLKMIRIIFKSHKTHLLPPRSEVSGATETGATSPASPGSGERR